MNPGRPFFIWIGTNHASTAPAASSASSTPGHSRGSRSSTLARTSTIPPRAALPPAEGCASARPGLRFEPPRAAVAPTTTRTTLGQPANSLPPAPTPTASTVSPGSGSQADANARTTASPVGVANSPTVWGVVVTAGVSWWWAWS